ncbi:hypothetical protein [Deinococcus aquaticus]|uniref:hypothetical protein n=1 Tax=Deinococcus aquaticus TaxID=328692 RepID=UPI003F47A55B
MYLSDDVRKNVVSMVFLPDETGTCGKAEAVLSAFSVVSGIVAQIKIFTDPHEEKVKISSAERRDPIRMGRRSNVLLHNGSAQN